MAVLVCLAGAGCYGELEDLDLSFRDAADTAQDTAAPIDTVIPDAGAPTDLGTPADEGPPTDEGTPPADEGLPPDVPVSEDGADTGPLCPNECDDGDPCTGDTCLETGECQHVPLPVMPPSVATLAFESLDGEQTPNSSDTQSPADVLGADKAQLIEDGKAGKALSLGGVASVVLKDPGLGDASFTLAAWVRTQPAEAAQTLFAYGSVLVTIGDGAIVATLPEAGAGTLTAEVGVADGEWRHVALVRNAQESLARLYVDGLMAAEGIAAAGVAPLDPSALIIGTAPGTNDHLQGDVDQVQVWTEAVYFAAPQITAYAADAPPPACDDGDACTEDDLCGGAAACAGTVVVCADDTVCTTDSCDPASGCIFKSQSGPCEDGDACTTPDTCAAGSCVGGSKPVCDDGNPCTVDGCDSAIGCTYTPPPTPPGLFAALSMESIEGDVIADDSGQGNDGKVATQGVAGLVPGFKGQALAIADGGYVTLPNPDFGDGSFTLAAWIRLDEPAGQTVFAQGLPTVSADTKGIALRHDPGSLSFEMPALGLSVLEGKFVADGQWHHVAAAFDAPMKHVSIAVDGEIVGELTLGQAPAAVVTDQPLVIGTNIGTNHHFNGDIDDVTVWKSAVSFDAAGVPYVGEEKPPGCDDNDKCTVSDSCNTAGACVGAPMFCTDSDACTLGDTCVEGACEPGADTKPCNDGVACTADSCNPVVGCVNEPNNGACDDGVACTADSCAPDGCANMESAAACDDGQPCTLDVCDKSSGCSNSDSGLCAGPGLIGCKAVVYDAENLGWLDFAGPTFEDMIDPVANGKNMEGSLSPDATQIAFVSNRKIGATNDTELFISSVEGGPQTQLTSEKYTPERPAWTPAGDALLFVIKAPSSEHDIYYVDISIGSSSVMMVTDIPFGKYGPGQGILNNGVAISPDGGTLFYTQSNFKEPPSPWRLQKIAFDLDDLGETLNLKNGTSLTLDSSANLNYPDVSNDGEFVTVMGTHGGSRYVYYGPVAGPVVRKDKTASDGNAHPRFLPNGDVLYQKDNADLYVYRTKTDDVDLVYDGIPGVLWDVHCVPPP